MPYPVVRLHAQENYDQVVRDKFTSTRVDMKQKERRDASLQLLSDAGLHDYIASNVFPLSFAHIMLAVKSED